jgi:hypothetical protein
MTPTSKHSYKVTSTLLNSWAYIYQVDADKADDAYQSFLKTLQRIKEPPNFFMIRGLEFEKNCYSGVVPVISNTIRDGAFQVYAQKHYVVDGVNVTLLGVLDALKAGVIYDIKRVNQYDLQKYLSSYQHHIYLDLIDDADKFIYLVAAGSNDNYLDFYQEEYTRADKIDVTQPISLFFQYLKDNGLWQTYLDNWRIEKTGELL